MSKKKMLSVVLPAVLLVVVLLAASIPAQNFVWEKLKGRDYFYVIFTDGEKSISTQMFTRNLYLPEMVPPEGKTAFEGWYYTVDGEEVLLDPATFDPPTDGSNFMYVTPKYS